MLINQDSTGRDYASLGFRSQEMFLKQLNLKGPMSLNVMYGLITNVPEAPACHLNNAFYLVLKVANIFEDKCRACTTRRMLVIS